MDSAKKLEFNKALQIGIVCVCSYIVSYYMRNLLSVTSPEMLNTGRFTTELLGTLSSIYMLFYATGQLINGIIGDVVKPKWMITCGMILCGIASILFSFIELAFIKIILFAIIGLSLSMLRGPLVKTITENTLPKYSRTICTFFSFASFSGPLIASLISMIFDWRKTFIVAGIIAITIGLLVYIIFTIFEMKKRINYTLRKKSFEIKSFFKIFRLKHFCFYLLVGGIAEISSASINFWIPTYFSGALLLSENLSKTVFSSMSFIKCVVPFIALFLFNKLKEKDIIIIRGAYLLSSIFFIGMLLSIKIPYINIMFLLLGQMSIGISSALLWSIYIPLQREGGMVSTINGVFDFSGYLFASFTNIIFANVIGKLGWNSVIILWISLPVLGLLVSACTKQHTNNIKNQGEIEK